MDPIFILLRTFQNEVGEFRASFELIAVRDHPSAKKVESGMASQIPARIFIPDAT
jgi:hypothetical protein